MSLQFGTDGVRGDARTELSEALVASLSRAAAEELGAAGFVVGRDTRVSGPALAAAVHSGVFAAGGNSVDVGIVPTPAVALWCRDHDVAGAVVSASHNPWYDNGVKFFAPGGAKLSDDVQGRIQSRFDELLEEPYPGAVASFDDRHQPATEAHIAAVVGSLDGRRLDGIRAVVDLANGAATTVAEPALRALGVDLVITSADPDGHNINANCGSTHPQALAAAVVSEGADVGVAFDGDADRLVASDHAGTVVDGDEIIAICALDAHRRSALRGPAVVVTVMTNLGFRRSMAEAGIEVVDTPVGDRHVLEALERRDLPLGGEQSGHVIFRDLAPTGDGLLTSVQLLDVVARTGRSLADLAASAMVRLPQVLVNVPLARRYDDLDVRLGGLISAAENRLVGRGRVLIRPSGTEPLVRVMVEAESDAEAAMEAAALSDAIASLLC